MAHDWVRHLFYNGTPWKQWRIKMLKLNFYTIWQSNKYKEQSTLKIFT